MIVIYLNTAPLIDDCPYYKSIKGINSLTEHGGKLWLNEYKSVIDTASRVGWFAVPEQPIIYPSELWDAGEDDWIRQPTVGELKLVEYNPDELTDILNTKSLTELTKEVAALKTEVATLKAKSP